MSGLSVRCVDLTRVFETDDATVTALDGVSFEIEAGTAAAILGPSGSGKSTLMTILGGLQRATSGDVFIGETNMCLLTEPELLQLRAEHLAVVAQNPYRNLLPYGSAEDNLRFAQRGPRSYGRQDLPEPIDLLERLGLGALAKVRVDRVSGGERQRLALGVALATGPDVLLADEPTSQLDESNRDVIVDLLRRMTGEFGVTVVTVTHDPVVAERLGRSIVIRDGRLVDGGAQ